MIEINTTLSELEQLLSSFEKEQINIVPFEGSWTAGQLAQHMILSNGGFVELLEGPVKETLRDPIQHVEEVKNSFLDFNTKMESPDFIKPAIISYDKEELIGSLKNLREKINQSIKTSDLNKTCMAFELPVFGYFTGQECIHFVFYHTQRHIHQLKNIFQKVVSL